MAATYSVNVDSERLVMARWTSFRAISEAEDFRGMILKAVAECKPKAIICADWRAAHIVSPEISAVLYSMLSGVHGSIERSAILLTQDHAAFNLQAERLVREAASPNRRTFRDSGLQLKWLAEALTSTQQSVAERFLAEVG